MQKILVAAFVIISIISCKDKDSNTNFQIDVNIEGVPDGRMAILKKQVDRKVINLDTTYVKDAKFSFKGNIKEPIIFGVFVDSIKRGAIFPFIDVNDHVMVKAYKDSLNKSKITGSKLNDVLTKMREKRDILTAETQKYLPEFQKAHQVKDTVTTNRINKEVKKIANKMALNDWSFVKNNPNSYVAPLIFNGLMSNPTYKDSVRIVFANFSDEVKKAAVSKPIRDYFEYLDKQNKPTEEAK